MNSRLLRKYIRESLGREIMLSPQRLRSRMTGGEQQRELTVVETIDKTRLSDEEVLEELIVAAGPDTYIRFEKNYGNLEFPPLKVSPVIQHQTPHGIYGYPLDQVNVENLVNFGSPTSADFATDFEFFHVYKLDKSRTANVSAKGYDDIKQIIGRYSTEKKVIDDIAECIRIVCYLFHESKHKPPIELSPSTIPRIGIEQDITKFTQNQSQINLSDIFNRYKNHVVKTSETSNASKKLIEFYKQEIASAIFKRKKASVPTQRRNQNSTKQFLLFKILKSSIGYIAEQFGYSEGVKRSQYYSLLLKSIGITGITDLRTSTIHDNEPSQAVSFDFSGDTIKPIGTFKNIFKIANFDDLKEKFNQILKDLTKSKLINWSTDFFIERPRYDYKNMSLKSVKLLIKTKKNDPSKLLGFINNIAENNVFDDVLNYIYDNKDLLEINGIEDNLFRSLSKNKNLPESISNDFYKDFIKDNINLSNRDLEKKLGFQGCYFAIDFVRSPALAKEAMFDIIEKSKSDSDSFAMRALKVSNHLDREVSEKIIEKFGLDALLHNASTAPITDYYLDYLIETYKLHSKKLSDFKSFGKNKISEQLCDILRNPHAKDSEIKYVILKLYPLLKEISKIKLTKYVKAWRDFDQYIYHVMYGLAESKRVTADHLEAANLTREEKINILNIFSYILFENDEEMSNADGAGEGNEEFDMLNQGLKILNSSAVSEISERLKIIFNDAYIYFVNAKNKM